MRVNMQDRVDKILINIPRCRDCDVYLIYEIWAKEMKVDINKVSLLDTLSLWKNKKISHPSAIMRARRKVQEQNPQTRGKVWEQRHEQQRNVRRDLGYDY
tara:strand:+ start:788 stop:1087 length:300 start_codon:yes stop_codon:yes gene_type:complete